MMFNKYMLVAPAGADIRDENVLASLVRSTAPAVAAIRGEGVLDVLDHAAAVTGYGGKLAFDLTGGKTAGVPLLEVPESVAPAGGISSWDMDYYALWGVAVLYAGPGERVDMEAFVRANCPGARCVVLLDVAAQGLAGGELLWLAAADTDAARDVSFCGDTVLVDARTKLPGTEGAPARFPNVVASSPEIVERVDARWEEYGIAPFMESPSRRYSRLLRGTGADVEW